MLGRKKAEPKTPHFLSLNQDIVVWSQEQKCGLKYVIYIPREMVGEFTHLRYGRSQIVLAFPPSLCMHGTLLSMVCKKRG